MGTGVDPEDAVRLAVASIYAILAVTAVQRLTAYGCCTTPRPNRTFHIILALFAATRTADLIEGVLVENDSLTAQKSIILSRFAISFFFSLCSQVVAQW